MAKVSGGEKIEARLKQIVSSLKSAKAVRVGFLEGGTYPDGTSIPEVAAFNEYGVPSHGQPPRPYFRNMIAAKKDEWPAAVATLLKTMNYDAHATLEATGEAIAGQLKASINAFSSPPLAPSTIAKKGFDKPLIDTSVMINAVDKEVET